MSDRQRTDDRRTRPAPTLRPLPELLAGLLILGLLIGGSTAQDGGTRVYLDKQAALAHVFPEASEAIELRHLLEDGEVVRVEELTGRPLAEGGFYLYAARSRSAAADAEPLRYAAIVLEIGKVRPITHIVSVEPDGRVGRVAVMIYRESHGADVAAPRFLAQYEGLSIEAPIRVDRDIINIAGSTLSAHAICRGVRKALAVVQAVLLDRTAAERNRLLAASGTPVTLQSAADPLPSVAGGLVRAERAVMGTLCRIEAWTEAGVLDDEQLADAAEAALDEVARWDAILSDWRPDTPLSRLNVQPVGEPFPLDPGLQDWLVDSRRWWQATDGAFDPGVGALVSAWGLRTQAPARPAAEDLQVALDGSGLRLLELDPAAGTATRTSDRLRLDPGASGKGWALDRAADVLRGRGVRRALLSFRSTLLALGSPPGQPGWPVPVTHEGRSAPVAELLLADGALSVSGGAAPTIDDAGSARGSVLDPQSGLPVPAGRLAWVRHASAATADALSTALLVRGPSLPAVEEASGVFVDGPDQDPRPWPVEP